MSRSGEILGDPPPLNAACFGVEETKRRHQAQATSLEEEKSIPTKYPSHLKLAAEDALSGSAAPPLDSLTRMTDPLFQLREGRRARGLFLEGALCVAPFQHCVAGVTTCVEFDGNKGCVSLIIFNLIPPIVNDAELAAVLPEGGRIFISEPYLIGMPGGLFVLRVDNPQHVHITPPLCSPETNPREGGNEAFKAGRLVEARMRYLQCAFDSARRALEVDSSHRTAPKSHFRQGMACLELGRFDDSEVCFQKALALSPISKEYLKALNVARTCQLQRKGRYDWDMLLNSASVPLVGDFLGPVQVENRGEIGFVLVTTRNVERGELLLVENPLVKVDGSDYSFQAMLSEMCRRAQDDPWVLAALQALTSNSPSKRTPWSSPFRSSIVSENTSTRLDVNRMRRVLALNAFAGKTGRGTVIRFFHSFCNHSCHPSTFKVWLGANAQGLRAARDMRKGDLVTLSYIDCVASSEERRNELNRWGFRCVCELCGLEEASSLSKFRSDMSLGLLDAQRESSLRGAFDKFTLLRDLVEAKIRGVKGKKSLAQRQFVDVYLGRCRTAEEMGEVGTAVACQNEVFVLLQDTGWDVDMLSRESVLHLMFAERVGLAERMAECRNRCEQAHRLLYGEVKAVGRAIEMTRSALMRGE